MPKTPLHRAWQALPQGPRRRALSRATALLAPRPDWPEPAARAGIVVGGEISRASGLGEGARLMLAALAALRVPAWEMECGLLPPGEPRAPSRPDAPPAGALSVLPAGAPLVLPAGAPLVLPAGALSVLPAGAPLVLHVNAPLLPAALLRLPRGLLRGRRVIGYWAWELDVVPDVWRYGARFVHEIWAPSRFTAAALEPLAPGRVRVVPHPVATRPPAPSGLGRADFGLPAAAVVVLVSFNLASSYARKNPEAAIAAHRRAFGDRMDRLLVIKVTHPDHAPDDLERLQAAIAGAPNIRLETRLFPAADSHALTRCADIVLSLHRSEGFGLVPAEAMLLGRPVVATDWSGSTDFLDVSCGVPIPFTLIPAIDPRGVFEAPGAVWAEADVAAAASALVRLADDPAWRASLGEAGRLAAMARLGAAPLAEAVRALGLTVPAA